MQWCFIGCCSGVSKYISKDNSTSKRGIIGDPKALDSLDLI